MRWKVGGLYKRPRYSYDDAELGVVVDRIKGDVIFGRRYRVRSDTVISIPIFWRSNNLSMLPYREVECLNREMVEA